MKLSPKQKAIDLVYEFGTAELAICCVNEILATYKMFDLRYDFQIKYWKEVIKQLEKL